MDSREEEIILSHLEDLAEKSDTLGKYIFSDFLAPEQVQEALSMPVVRNAPYLLWGGVDSCERKLFCFGNAETTGCEPTFPIALIRVQPAMEKFAQQLSHRDFLGAVMNLGVKRQVVGDIFVSGNSAYIFFKEQIASFIIENLVKVKNTQVKCELLDINSAEGLEELMPKTQNAVYSSASERLDGIIAAVYKLSRGAAVELIKGGLVQINHRFSCDTAAVLKAGDLISVRGKGRFIYRGCLGQSKKGRLRIAAEMYVT